MTLRVRAKVLLHVWSYDYYDMTLSTDSNMALTFSPLAKRKRRRVKICDKSRCLRQSVELSRLDDVACTHVFLSTSASK